MKTSFTFIAALLAFELQAQEIPRRIDSPCEGECRVSEIPLNTGTDHNKNKMYGFGQLDEFWSVTNEPFPGPNGTPVN